MTVHFVQLLLILNFVLCSQMGAACLPMLALTSEYSSHRLYCSKASRVQLKEKYAITKSRWILSFISFSFLFFLHNYLSCSAHSRSHMIAVLSFTLWNLRQICHNILLRWDENKKKKLYSARMRLHMQIVRNRGSRNMYGICRYARCACIHVLLNRLIKSLFICCRDAGNKLNWCDSHHTTKYTGL